MVWTTECIPQCPLSFDTQYSSDILSVFPLLKPPVGPSRLPHGLFALLPLSWITPSHLIPSPKARHAYATLIALSHHSSRGLWGTIKMAFSLLPRTHRVFCLLFDIADSCALSQ